MVSSVKRPGAVETDAGGEPTISSKAARAESNLTM
jgi:hypothetical protein